MIEDTSTVMIKKEPEVLQEEQEDLIFSYLNADYMSTDSAPINDPPSPPYSTSSGSTDTAPLNNNDIDMIMDSPPPPLQQPLCNIEDPFFLQLQTALSEQGLTMPWPTAAAAAALATSSTIPFPGVQDPSCLMNIHPLIIPSPPAASSTNTTNQNDLLTQQPPPPLYHHPSFLPINNNNDNHHNIRSSSFSSSSSTTSNSDNEQSKKKRNGRKKKEVSIAPAPLKNLAPILPAAIATTTTSSSGTNTTTTVNNHLSPSIQPQKENLHHVGNVDSSSVINSLDKIPSSESNNNNNDINNTNHHQNNNINNTNTNNNTNNHHANNNTNQQQQSVPEKSPAEIAYAKRQERLIKNRAAALLSRKRKREHLTSLEEERQKLLNENGELITKVNTLEEKISTLEKENQELKKKLSTNSSSSLTSSLSPISFLTSQKYNHHHLATPKHAKTTGMVFMIILFSFALFTLPSSRTSQLTVGGSPKPNIPLIGSSTSRIPDIKLESIEKSETLTTATSTTSTDNNDEEINNDNNTTTTVPSDLILINRVQPKDLHSWVKNKLTQNQNQNSGTELIQWSGENKISETISATSSASNHLYLYAKEFSQLGFSNNKEQHKSILSLSTPSSSSSATIGSTLSIICPLNTTSHCETSYLQIDVLVIGSRVLQGELKHQYDHDHKMENINDNEVLLNDMKDDIIQSLLVKSSSPFNDSHYPLDSSTKKTILNRRKIRRKKLLDEKRKRISRVVLE